MKPPKRILKEAFRALGLEVSRYLPEKYSADTNPLGTNDLADIKRLLRSDPTIVFDVGANVGQSSLLYHELFPNAEIHAFEPSPTTFETLKHNLGYFSNIHLNSQGVGSHSGEELFLENSYPNMSSFLQPGEFGWGEIVRETKVDVTTIDSYGSAKNIKHISLLKTDTQGYDFEVLKGAREFLEQNRIELIFMEVMFVDIYKGLPAFDEIYRFLFEQNFRLVSFYRFHHQLELASFSDALFRNIKFHPA